MKLGTFSLQMDDKLFDQYDSEGVLIHPQNLETGMLVMSSREDLLKLHIYKLRLQDNEYLIEKKLTEKTFSTLFGMKYYLRSFSNYKAHQFTEFLSKHDK